MITEDYISLFCLLLCSIMVITGMTMLLKGATSEENETKEDEQSRNVIYWVGNVLTIVGFLSLIVLIIYFITCA